MKDEHLFVRKCNLNGANISSRAKKNGLNKTCTFRRDLVQCKWVIFQVKNVVKENVNLKLELKHFQTLTCTKVDSFSSSSSSSSFHPAIE